jgi:hypothetical protein
MKSKILVSILAAAALVFAGCGTPNTSKVPHAYQAAGKVIAFGVVQDPVTGQYSLGYRSGFLGGSVVPIFVATATNGEITVIMPDTVMSYEVGGKGGFFGSAASTVTFATGAGAVQTLLGGMHIPINAPYWTNSAVGIAVNLPLAGVLTPTVGTTITTTGTNGTTTTTGTTVPIVIKP